MRDFLGVWIGVFAVAGCADQTPYEPTAEDIAAVTSAVLEYVADSHDQLLGVHDTTWVVDHGRVEFIEELSPEEELAKLVAMYPDSLAALMTQFYGAEIPSYSVTLPARDDLIPQDSLAAQLERIDWDLEQFVVLSRPAFDPSGTRAALGVELTCTPLHNAFCGHNDLAILQRRGSEWVITDVQRRWVS